MFILAKLVTFAALTFSAVTVVSAVPYPAAAVNAKRDTNVLTILADLSLKLKGPAVLLSSIDASNATASVLSPIVATITSDVHIAIGQLKLLPDQSKIVTSVAVAAHLNLVFKTVLAPAGNILKISSVDKVNVTAALSPLGDVLNTLLEYVLDLVAELLTDVQSILNNLLGDLVGAILDLKLAPLIKSLKLKVAVSA